MYLPGVAQSWCYVIGLGPGLEASMASLQYATAGDSGTSCCQVTVYVLAFKGELFDTLLPASPASLAAPVLCLQLCA